VKVVNCSDGLFRRSKRSSLSLREFRMPHSVEDWAYAAREAIDSLFDSEMKVISRFGLSPA
jgi:hypothetical protein